MKSLEERQERERHRHEVIQKAAEAADRIILNGSNGSREETNYLTAEVARRLMERALLPFTTIMHCKDLSDD